MEIISILLVGFAMLAVVWLERVQHPWVNTFLEWIPAILFAYIIPAVVTHTFGLDLSTVKLHSLSKEIIMPMAIVFVMSALSFRQLRAVGLRPLLVFVSGSAAVALMPFLLLKLLGTLSEQFHYTLIDQEYWKGLITMAGSWIGGSTSQLVLKELVQCPEDMFLIILVLDNVLVNIWTIFMFQKIKRSEQLNRFFGINDPVSDFIADEVIIDQHSTKDLWTIGICLVSVALCYFIPSFIVKILVLSVVGLTFGNFLSFWNHALVIKGGGYLIIAIMAILGLKLNFDNFSLPWPVIVFAIVWLLSHYIVMMLVARALRLNMAWVPIASMANVGGISTAPAVTKAFNEEWMPHAILLAILSMVTGTYWGMLSIFIFERFF